MPRWEADAEERLKLAALNLYSTRGYSSTTVSDIAAHAGVTSRTYFRYFPDKREVLFDGADRLRDRVADGLRSAPADMRPFDAAVEAMSDCEDLFQLPEHERLRQRDAVIGTSSELQEREARKLGSIATVIEEGLVERGSDQDDARLVADLALVVFKQASRLWMSDPETSYTVVLDRAAAQLRLILAPEAQSTARHSQGSPPS